MSRRPGPAPRRGLGPHPSLTGFWLAVARRLAKDGRMFTDSRPPAGPCTP